jgi:hypothetical protein
MLLNTILFNAKSGSISKKKLILMGIVLFTTKLWLQSRLDKHRVKHRDIKIVWFSFLALICLTFTGWTILLIKLIDIFIHYFGNTWLAFGSLLALIILTVILGWLILKAFIKRLLKRLAAVLLIERFFV